jgi:hypothetical protein
VVANQALKNTGYNESQRIGDMAMDPYGVGHNQHDDFYMDIVGLKPTYKHYKQPITLRNDLDYENYPHEFGEVKPIKKLPDMHENKYGGSIQQYQNGGIMKKKVRITGTPEYAVGGDTRMAWNRSHQGVMPTRAWDHDRMRNNAGVMGIQQDVADLSAGSMGRLGQMAVSTPHGISPVDDWEGYQTGAYKYRPLQYETRRGNTVTGFKDYGTNYEQAIAENSNGKWFNDKQPAQWQSNDQGIPMASTMMSGASSTGYIPPVRGGVRAQQANWYTDEPTNYSVDSVRSAKYGGNIPGTYKDGGVYDVDQQEVDRLQKLGYKIKVL